MSEEAEKCPDCKRFKAHGANDVVKGFCPKWWAVRDKEAAEDCLAHKNENLPKMAFRDGKVVYLDKQPPLKATLIVMYGNGRRNHQVDASPRDSWNDFVKLAKAYGGELIGVFMG